MRCRAVERDTNDLCGRHEPRNILGRRAAGDAGAQVIRDALGDELERQVDPLDLAVETNDVQAITRLDWDLGHGPRRELCQRLFEFRGRLSGRDLAQISTMRRGRTSGVGPRQIAKPLRPKFQLREHRCGRCLRLRIALRIVFARGKEDMRRLVDRGRTEAPPILLVIAPAGFLVGRRAL